MSGKNDILKPLPSDMKEHLNSEPQLVKDFLGRQLNPKHRDEIDDDLKKVYILEAQKSRRLKKSKKPRISKKQLTSREKRQLGLYRLPKTGLLYTNFKELNELWTQYVRQLLDTPGLIESKWSPPENLDNAKMHELQMKICRADLHGAIIKVENAECPTHKGREGICLMETKHTLQIISADNKLRIFPKKGSVFSILVDGFKFTFPGSSMLAKPAERSTKKPKNKLPLNF